MHYALYHDDADVISISETWLNATVSNGMLDPECLFNIFRLDRQALSGGGGVCVFIRKHIHAVAIAVPPHSPKFECVCVDLLCNSKTKFRYISIYRPGGSSISDGVAMSDLVDCLFELCLTDVTCVVVGDLNCGNIDWFNDLVLHDSIQQRFFDAVCELGFQQYVLKPTRLENILDIILCNDPLLVIDVIVDPPFSTSDHCLIRFTLNIATSSEASNHVNLNTYDKGNRKLNNVHNCFLSRNWHKASWIDMTNF